MMKANSKDRIVGEISEGLGRRLDEEKAEMIDTYVFYVKFNSRAMTTRKWLSAQLQNLQKNQYNPRRTRCGGKRNGFAAFFAVRIGRRASEAGSLLSWNSDSGPGDFEARVLRS